MSFKKNKYIVIKEAVPKDIAEFVYNYFLLKELLLELCLIKGIFLNLQKSLAHGMIHKFQIHILTMQI